MKFLEEQKLTADEFVGLVKQNPTDDEMIKAIKNLKK